MLRLQFDTYDQDSWNSLIGGFAHLNLLQRWEYAEAKTATGPWSVERGAFLKGDDPVGAFQAMVRPLPYGLPGGLAWINRGPLCKNENHRANIMTLLHDFYVKERGLYLCIAPPVTMPENAKGFSSAKRQGWASALVDLSPSEEDLRRNLKRKWRGHLNKSERCDLELRSGTEGEIFGSFLESHQSLITQKGFATSVTTDFLRALQSLCPADAKMEAFMALHQGKPVATALMVKYGDICEYLAGSVGEGGRRTNAGQFVLWGALLAMKKQGFKHLDVSGMDPDLTPAGIYTFKEGLGGVPYCLADEVEAHNGGIFSRLVRWRVQRARANG